MGTTKRERQKANRQQRLEELAKTARKDKTRRTATLVSVVVVGGVLLLFGLSYLFGDDDDDGQAAQTTLETLPSTTLDPTATTVDQNTTSTTEGPTTTVAVAFTYGTGPCPAGDGSSEMPATLEAPAKCIDETKGYVAEVVGTRGNVPFELEITLDAAKSPGNVNNFVTLARYGYYDGTDCHRIIKDFVVQCGRRGGDESAPGYTVTDELPAPDSYYEGVVAMANAGPNSAGGQFFIVTGPQGAALGPNFTIIGQVTRGYVGGVSVLEGAADPLASNGVPTLFPVTIESITVTELDSPPETTVPTTTTTTTTPLPETVTSEPGTPDTGTGVAASDAVDASTSTGATRATDDESNDPGTTG